MTPFQQFRVWFRRANPAQQAMTVVAGLLTVSLVSWLVIPADVDSQGASAGGFQFDESGGDAPGPNPEEVGGVPTSEGGLTASSGPGGTGSSAADNGAGAAPGQADGGAGDPGPSAVSKRCPSGTDEGATEDEVRVAITIINIGGAVGNETIGVPTPEHQEEQWRIVSDALNAEDGFGCRKLMPEFYRVNPVNPADAQEKCLAIANSGPFLVIDTGSLAQVGASDCIPNQKIPMVAHFLTRQQLQNYYPYYISMRGLLNDTIRNGVLAYKQLGYFGAAKGFKKLGLLHRSCRPDPIKSMRDALREAGVPDGSIVSFDLGCAPGQQNTPADYQQAALTFRNAGATHVTEADVNDFVNFTLAAGQQNYKPQYILANGAIPGVTDADNPQQPDAANFDGALDVVDTRYGESHTPGFQPSGDTARCNAIFAAKKHPPVYEQQVGYGGVICSLLWFVQAMISRAPEMKRDALVPAMNSIGKLDLSYPDGPADFAAAPKGAPFPAPAWRVVQYFAECRCFRVVDPVFKPTFPR